MLLSKKWPTVSELIFSFSGSPAGGWKLRRWTRPSRPKSREMIIIGDRWAMKPNFVTIYHALWENLRDKPYFVDFRNILTPRRQEVYESDGIHLNPTGDGMVAAEIGLLLKKRFAGQMTASG